MRHGPSLRAIALLSALPFGAALGCASPLLVCPAQGGPAWSEIDTPHFVLKTDLPADQARSAAVRFEVLRAALAKAMGAADSGAAERVEVIVFADPETFHAFDKPTDNHSAYSTERLRLDVEPSPVVVLPFADDADGRAIFLHELTHMFEHGRFADLPVWLDEGIAQYYETLRVEGGRAFVGAPPPRPGAATFWTTHYAARFGVLIPLTEIPPVDTLLRADRATFYGENLGGASRGAIVKAAYYAGAFRLVHLFMTGPAEYRARFAAYVAALGRGEKPGAALGAFGGLDALQRSYAAYVAAPTLPERGFDLGAPEPPPPMTTRTLRDAEVHVLWSRLRPTGDRFVIDIVNDLDAALAEEPRLPEARLRRALFHAKHGRPDVGEPDLAVALGAGPNDPRTLLARLELYSAYDPAAYRCGARSPAVDATVARLARVARTGVELAAVASYLEGHGDADGALRFADEAVRRAPLCWSCADTLSQVLVAKGDLAGALVANARARGLLPESSRDPGPEQRRRMIEALLAPQHDDPPGDDGEGTVQEGDGTLPTAVVDTILRGHADGFVCCHQLGRGAYRRPGDHVTLVLTVESDGRVSAATLEDSTLARPEMEQCIVHQALTLRFPPPEGGAVRLHHAIRFGRRGR